jgi:hypothetical protein
MTELDRLPPDQRAVLSLVLERGKSYGEVAEMLAISERAVRDRAHAALDALAAVRPSPETRRAGDTLTQTRADTRSPGEWGAPADTPSSARPPQRRRAGAGTAPRSSKLGGALLLGGIAVAIVVAVILLTSGGKSSGGASTTPSTGNTASTPTSSTAAGSKVKIDNKLALTAVEPELKASGEAYVLAEGSRRAFYVSAHGLPPSSGFFYAVWLYNSPSSSAPLGRAPSVGADGRLEGGGPLPSSAGDYAKLIVTRETSTHATHPGTIVLNGPFALH